MGHARRGQITLEFLFIFGLLTILMLYSVRNTSFTEGYPSVENLKIQVALEEKSLANAISNTISQVYAQGPGSKATTYVKLTYLRNRAYLQKASGLNDPVVFITYGPSDNGNGTYVGLIEKDANTVLYAQGENKNVVWSGGLFNRDLSTETACTSGGTVVMVWNPSAKVTIDVGVPRVFNGMSIDPGDLNPTIKIVVEWNPEECNAWFYNTTAKELRININPGG